MDSARHVIKRILNPYYLAETASYPMTWCFIDAQIAFRGVVS